MWGEAKAIHYLFFFFSACKSLNIVHVKCPLREFVELNWLERIAPAYYIPVHGFLLKVLWVRLARTCLTLPWDSITEAFYCVLWFPRRKKTVTPFVSSDEDGGTWPTNKRDKRCTWFQTLCKSFAQLVLFSGNARGKLWEISDVLSAKRQYSDYSHRAGGD